MKNKQEQYINLEYTQSVSRIDSKYLDLLNNNSLDMVDTNELVKLIVCGFSNTDGTMKIEINSLFFVTIQTRSDDLKNLLSQFHNGDLFMDLYLNTISTLETNSENKIVEFFKQELPLKFNIYKTFSEECSNLSYLFNIINQRHKTSKAYAEFKITNIDFKLVNETLLNGLNYESVLNSNNSKICVLFMKKQSVLSGCICVTRMENLSSGTSLSVLCK